MTQDGASPPAIPAATVVVVRDGELGVETLMLRKSPGIGFGGMWVFPGGRIEAADADSGDEARSAAAREAAEETGLILGHDALIPYAHWCPPPAAPKRFDTMFFIAASQDGSVVVDGGEIHDYAWARPAEFLERHSAGQAQLAPPTWVTLRRLVPFATVAEVLVDARAVEVETFVTHLAKDADDQLIALWHGDIAYDGGPLDAPGGRHRLSMIPGAWRHERS